MKITTFASPRDAVATIAARNGETLAGVARLLGRQPRYIDRFVREGRPRQLARIEQQKLADYFGADPRDFGAPDRSPSALDRALARDRSKLGDPEARSA